MKKFLTCCLCILAIGVVGGLLGYGKDDTSVNVTSTTTAEKQIVIEETEATTTTADEEKEEEILTVDNCPELADILSEKRELAVSYSDFADEYEGRIIEFAGCIVYCARHGDYKTRFDYLVSAGDYDPDHQVGPSFKFDEVAYFDLHTNLDTVSVGMNVYITAEVLSYNSSNGLFFLDPVKITGRKVD